MFRLEVCLGECILSMEACYNQKQKKLMFSFINTHWNVQIEMQQMKQDSTLLLFCF